jgi:hypothetical protein
MQIWEMEAYPCGDMRLPHHVFPPKFIGLSQLSDLAGVHLYKASFYFIKLQIRELFSLPLQVDLDDTMAMKKRLTRVREQYKVCGADVVTLDKNLGDLEIKVGKERLIGALCRNWEREALLEKTYLSFDIRIFWHSKMKRADFPEATNVSSLCSNSFSCRK